MGWVGLDYTHHSRNIQEFKLIGLCYVLQERAERDFGKVLAEESYRL